MTTHSILFVEDDPALRLLTARALRDYGYDVRTAATGAEMWAMLETQPADLIVLDIMLPGGNGLELLRRLRKQSEVPVIFVSARGSEEDRVLGLELGADDYLPKPFGTRELAARIAAVFRRGSAAGGAVGASHGDFLFEGWTLSPARHELRASDGTLVDLTGAEFELLTTFVEQPQRVVARHRLLELSRMRLGDSSDRSIDVLVSRLRRKLDCGDGRLIVTVRGVGYMFTAPVERR
ncbi:two component transcriptional regulator [Novosphingobium nitrogenifigens DSM 19370]|uniref:Regulatory protein VirG n=1 Tax=Novosphingobium nitrogenifigens DSM 19370 TaxID=983920 RepID=F1Z3H6_9SPHN|nr:response regulator transcription factor [Novosphingobium nitrogenifigens]EGD60790.1 two component transcriptional regulator [Novosphingobium nitrogenifigens DSM 19370]